MADETTAEVGTEEAAAAPGLLGDNVSHETEAGSESDPAPEVPDWLDTSKYKSVEEQAQAYDALRKDYHARLNGEWERPPEGDYAVNLPEGIEMDIPEGGTPLLNDIQGICRDLGIGQGGFDRLIEAYATSAAAENIQARTFSLEALGEGGQAMVDQVKEWGQANLAAEEWNICQQAAAGDPAAAVKMADLFIKRVQSATTIPVEHAPADAGGELTKEALVGMMGDERYGSDPNFSARVDELHEQYVTKQRRAGEQPR